MILDISQIRRFRVRGIDITVHLSPRTPDDPRELMAILGRVAADAIAAGKTRADVRFPAPMFGVRVDDRPGEERN